MFGYIPVAPKIYARRYCEGSFKSHHTGNDDMYASVTKMSTNGSVSKISYYILIWHVSDKDIELDGWEMNF